MRPSSFPRGEAAATSSPPAYAETRDSGVEWLGEVPTHWDVQRLKHHMDDVNEGAPDDGGRHWGSARCLALEDVESWTGRCADGQPASSYDSELKHYRTGDILFGKLRPYLAKVARPDRDGYCVGEFLVLRARNKESDPAFLERLLRSQPLIQAVNGSTSGARMPRANWGFLGRLPVPLPPPSEQTAIVRCLDYVDRRIRRYIRAKEKLIAVLEEQKQAVIHQAVTGQIDVRAGRPYPEYKDSGVEWLGEVPAHWGLGPAKRFFKEVDHRSDTGSEELLSVSHVTGVTPRSQKNVTMFEARSKVGYKLCRPGDIVVNTMWAWMAALGVARHVGIVSPSYAVYRPLHPRDLAAEYVDSLLRTKTYKSEYVRRSTGIQSSRLRLYPDEFLRIRLLRPPLDEQCAIVGFVDKALRNARDASSFAARQRSLLQQYRTRLIADVVTGKLDVREAAASLPEADPLEADELRRKASLR